MKTDSNENKSPAVAGRNIGSLGQNDEGVAPQVGVGRKKIVRAMSFIKEMFSLRTKKRWVFLPKMTRRNSVRKDFVCFVQRIFADGIPLAFFTQGDVSVRSSLNFALGYQSFAPTGQEKYEGYLCIKE